MNNAQAVLEKAVVDDRPIVAVLGQSSGFSGGVRDTVLAAALTRLQIDGSSWTDIFSAGELDSEFYGWLNGRFEHRAPQRGLISIADAHLSAVFTSSIDPVLRKLFQTDGRQPETVLVGDPPPPVSRSKLKPRLYYLFGMTGAGIFEPPLSRLALNSRRSIHSIPMLNSVLETSTPLGIVVVDGFRAESDWLKPSEVLGTLGNAPPGAVLWFGNDPNFLRDDAEIFSDLVEREIILRDSRPFGTVYTEISATGAIPKLHTWNEPGIVSFLDGKSLITSPTMRLSTEAAASIVDDTWTDHLPPLHESQRNEEFATFHSIPSSNRLLFFGVRRGYAIERDFEEELRVTTLRALRNHANEKGAIVLSGQSGIGKSLSLYRLACRVRDDRSAAVLYAKDRIPSPVELVSFLSEVDKLDKVTLLIVDSLEQPRRYDSLLESFRSRGHRIVIVGSSYGLDTGMRQHDGRLIRAEAKLSDRERSDLQALVKEYFSELEVQAKAFESEHALAQFFWRLPHSRSRLGLGLGREARYTERELRTRGQARQPTTVIGNVGLALLQAGYQRTEVPIFAEELQAVEEENQAASRLIDYIMVCSRLYRWVPVNLVLRAIVSAELVGNNTITLELVRDLFEGHDLFRWRYDDNQEDHLLVGARLQIEAQLICDTRLGGPGFEVERILDLISNATRAGPEGAEETRFIADIVFALGPDGPLGDRYRASYYDIALALSRLRTKRGVRNARLMLQEATLRRHFVRRNEAEIDDETRSRILDEARAAVDEALADIARRDGTGLRAARRTEENLWVERAATYGFLASAAARSGGSPDTVWSSYLAAREAVRNATGKVDTYFPLDIALWLPLEILEHRQDLGVEPTNELRADVIASIDMVSDDTLDGRQVELFRKQKLRAGGVLDISELSEDAFKTLDEAGSTVGYFFRGRQLAPERGSGGSKLSASQVVQAETATEYLLRNRERISGDPRCIRLLLNCFWTWKTATWLFEGLRQPIPCDETDRRRVLEILMDLAYASGDDFQPRFRYLSAVVTWLIGNVQESIAEFRRLARDTEYVEGKRVLPRHLIVDQNGNAVSYSGVIERQIGAQRWSVRVRELGRTVDLVSGRWEGDIHVGRELRNFNVAFNYLGPLASRAD